jgi:tRNA(fMet)-specific endonuclease VapC
MEYLVDTTFLIRRWREGATSCEQRFIDSHGDAVVGMPWVVKAEFLRGAMLADHPAAEVAAFTGRFRVVWPDEDTVTLYASTYASLVRQNQMIGPYNLWIAVSALQTGLPLLTRNVAEFQRVAGLIVEDYCR